MAGFGGWHHRLRLYGYRLNNVVRMSIKSLGCRWLLSLAFCVASTQADQALIAHVEVTNAQLTLNTARLMFSMQMTQWPNGMPVRVFVLPDNHNNHRDFAKNLLNLYPRQLRRVWDRQLYSGTGQPPETVASEAEMRRKVSLTPGAIGYLSSEEIDDSVQVLSIH